MKRAHYIIVAILASGCQFTPEGTVLTDVQLPDLESINLTSLPDGDTIFISTPTEFTVTVEAAEDQIVVGNYVIINDTDTLNYSVPSETIEHTVFPLEYETGIHKIAVIFKLKSGSGSLAEILDAEFIYVYREWYFEVYNEAAATCEITEVNLVDGSLRTSWTPYNQPHFGKYVLKKGAYLSLGDFGYIVENEFTDIATTQYIDTTYVGGDLLEFRVDAFDQFGRKTPSNIVTYEDADAIRVLHVERKSGGLEVKWNRNAYYNAFKAYGISIPTPGGGSYTEVHLTESLDDTTALIDKDFLEFGATQRFNVHVFNRTFQPQNWFNGWSTSLEYTHGQKFQGHEILQHVPSIQSIYTYYQGTIFRLDETTLDTLASMSYSNLTTFAVSPNGQYAAASNSTVVSIHNPLTLDRTLLYTFSNLTDGVDSSPLDDFTLSNNNLLSSHNSNNRNFVSDLTTGARLYWVGLQSNPGKISADGAYYFDGDKFYTISGPTFTMIMDLPGSGKKVVFNSNFPGRAVVVTPSSKLFESIDLSTQTPINSFNSLYSPTSIMLDESSNQLLIGESTTWSIHQYEDGALTLDMGTSTLTLPYYLFNGRLFRGEYLIPIDEW